VQGDEAKLTDGPVIGEECEQLATLDAISSMHRCAIQSQVVVATASDTSPIEEGLTPSTTDLGTALRPPVFEL
jgi:hypothetical protein